MYYGCFVFSTGEQRGNEHFKWPAQLGMLSHSSVVYNDYMWRLTPVTHAFANAKSQSWATRV